MRAVPIKNVFAECTTCGEQAACTIVDGDQLSEARATLVALGAAGWRLVTYDNDDDDDAGGGCYAAMGGLPGGRGA